MRSWKVKSWKVRYLAVLFYRGLQPRHVWKIGHPARPGSTSLSHFPTFPLLTLFFILTTLPIPAHSALPSPERIVLENGFTVLQVKQDQLPLVAARLVIRTGATADPPGKEGLAALTAMLLKKGAGERQAVEIAETIDFNGGLLNVDFAHDAISITGSMLARDRHVLLALLADMVIRPTFEEAEIAREQERMMAAITQTRERAGHVVDTFFNRALYGPHPYSRPQLGIAAAMSALKRADLTSFHQTYFTPANAFLVLVGDFRADDAEKEVRQLFGQWKRKPLPELMSALPLPLENHTIHVIDKPDISQAHVRLGILGIPRHHPDYLPLMIVNTILGGGGFTSRLMDRIRVNKGLTYGIESRFTGQRERGAFVVASFTRTETTGALIEAILDELHRLREKGVSTSEIRTAKQYLSGVFPLSIEGPAALANQLAGIELFGLPENYIETYNARVNGVSHEEINRVIQAHIPGEVWLAVVLGKADDIIPQIAHLGSIERHVFEDLDQ